LFLTGCVGAGPTSITTSKSDRTADQIPFTLHKPDGLGPFPAVVIMHDCSGLRPRSSDAPERWAKELTGRGYVILIPDSFTTRGHADGVCTDPSPSRRDVSPSRRVSDAYAALAYAHTLSFVDPSRGGPLTRYVGVYKPLAPMFILIGEKDDWTPAEPCRKLVEAAQAAGYPISIKVYRGSPRIRQ